MNYLEIKKALHLHCLSAVQERIQNAKNAMNEAQAAANQEGKSSAGDKYETGRAMMQIERDKNAQQLAQVLKLHQILKQINPSQRTDYVQLGSLVLTNQGAFLVAVSLGKLTHENQTYFAISLATPLGRQLHERKVGEGFVFNQQKYEIFEIF